MTNQGSPCEEIVSDYLRTLGREFSILVQDGKCLIVTPFTRPDGEAIEIEAEVRLDGSVRLSDMGDTLSYLYVNGLTLARSILSDARRISRSNRVIIQQSEITAEATDISESGEKLLDVIQASLRVSDLIQRRRPTSRVQFDDVLESFLVNQRTNYDSDYVVRGRASAHTIRFHVDSGRHMLIQPLSASNEGSAFSWAERWAYRFGDIKAQDPTWRTFAILDDRGDRAEVWQERARAPIESQATVVPWSESGVLAEAIAELGERNRDALAR